MLVVEDNAVNQLITRSLVERLGHRVDVAGNGLEAVEMILQIEYDLVLMDCQMPEMDGFEATQAIRRWEAGHGQCGRRGGGTLSGMRHGRIVEEAAEGGGVGSGVGTVPAGRIRRASVGGHTGAGRDSVEPYQAFRPSYSPPNEASLRPLRISIGPSTSRSTTTLRRILAADLPVSPSCARSRFASSGFPLGEPSVEPGRGQV